MEASPRETVAPKSSPMRGAEPAKGHEFFSLTIPASKSIVNPEYLKGKLGNNEVTVVRILRYGNVETVAQAYLHNSNDHCNLTGSSLMPLAKAF